MDEDDRGEEALISKIDNVRQGYTLRLYASPIYALLLTAIIL